MPLAAQILRSFTSHETPAFAVDAIALWWNSCGQKTYPQAQELLVLADAGGSNGVRPLSQLNRRASRRRNSFPLTERFRL
jgi:hypothetical protein